MAAANMNRGSGAPIGNPARDVTVIQTAAGVPWRVYTRNVDPPAAEDLSMSTSIERVIQILGNEGNETQKQRAAELIRIHCREDIEWRQAVVERGGVILLSQLIQSSNPQAVEHAVTALHNISLSVDLIPAIMADDCLRALILVLETGSPEAKSVSAAVLYYLAKRSTENSEKISSFNEIYGPIVRMLQSSNLRHQKDASYVICHISLVEYGRAQLAQEGLVNVLFDLLLDGTDELEPKITPIVYNMSKCPEALEEMVTPDKVDAIADLLGSPLQGSKEYGIGILLQVTNHSEDGYNAVSSAGVLLTLGSLCRSDKISARGKQKAELLIRTLRERVNVERPLSSEWGFMRATSTPSYRPQ